MSCQACIDAELVCDSQGCETAEALRAQVASARELANSPTFHADGSLADLRKLLTSHPAPAPVAVPPPVSKSDEDVVGALIEARTPASKPMATPVAAPCAGCEAAKELLEDMSCRVEIDDCGLFDRHESWLKEHP